MNLIYDSVGSINTPRTFFSPLIEVGVNVLEFNPVNPLTAKKGWQINQRDHRKLLIVDGKTVFLGGINIRAEYSGGSSDRRRPPESESEKIPWRDTHMQIDGPIVVSFQRMFISTWNKQRGVAVKIILPGHTDSALVFHAGRSHYMRILESGIEIYERHDKLLHAKTVFIDRV